MVGLGFDNFIFSRPKGGKRRRGVFTNACFKPSAFEVADKSKNPPLKIPTSFKRTFKRRMIRTTSITCCNSKAISAKMLNFVGYHVEHCRNSPSTRPYYPFLQRNYVYCDRCLVCGVAAKQGPACQEGGGWVDGGPEDHQGDAVHGGGGGGRAAGYQDVGSGAHWGGGRDKDCCQEPLLNWFNKL